MLGPAVSHGRELRDFMVIWELRFKIRGFRGALDLMVGLNLAS